MTDDRPALAALSSSQINTNSGAIAKRKLGPLPWPTPKDCRTTRLGRQEKGLDARRSVLSRIRLSQVQASTKLQSDDVPTSPEITLVPSRKESSLVDSSPPTDSPTLSKPPKDTSSSENDESDENRDPPETPVHKNTDKRFPFVVESPASFSCPNSDSTRKRRRRSSESNPIASLQSKFHVYQKKSPQESPLKTNKFVPCKAASNLAKRRISGGHNFRYWNVTDKSCSFSSHASDINKENISPVISTPSRSASGPVHHTPRPALGERLNNVPFITPTKTPTIADDPSESGSRRKSTPLFTTKNGKAQLFLGTTPAPSPTPTRQRVQNNDYTPSRPKKHHHSTNPSKQPKFDLHNINLSSMADTTANAALLRMVAQRARSTQKQEKQDKEAAILNLLALKSGVWS